MRVRVAARISWVPVEAARESADGGCFAQPQCRDITRTLTLRRRRARIPWIYLLYHRDTRRPARIDESGTSALLPSEKRRHVENGAHVEVRVDALCPVVAESGPVRDAESRQFNDAAATTNGHLRLNHLIG